MTKPDNLITGSILLLIVERRLGNLDHHPNFAIGVLNEACRGCFYYTCVENFVTANLPEVPVGCNSQQTLASLRSPGQGRASPVQHDSEWIFNAAFRINNINPIQAGGTMCPCRFFPCCAKPVYSS